MRCATESCGLEFKRNPNQEAPPASCPHCHCIFYFNDEGELQGPPDSGGHCQVCGEYYTAPAKAIYVDRTPAHELHECPGSRSCGEGCEKPATKIAMAYVGIEGQEQGCMIAPPGGWALCEDHGKEATAKELAKQKIRGLPSLPGGKRLDPDAVEITLHEIDWYKPGGRFAARKGEPREPQKAVRTCGKAAPCICCGQTVEEFCPDCQAALCLAYECDTKHLKECEPLLRVAVPPLPGKG